MCPSRQIPIAVSLALLAVVWHISDRKPADLLRDLADDQVRVFVPSTGPVRVSSRWLENNFLLS